MKMVLSASIVIHNFVSTYSPIGEIIAFKRRKLLLPGGHCLFGAPNPEETTKLINDQLFNDRQRMLDQYDFDIVTNSTTENVNLKKDLVSSSSSKGGDYGSSNNNNEGEKKDFDEDVLKRIRGEDGDGEGSGNEGGVEERRRMEENDRCKDGLRRVRKGAAFKRQSHLTDFWRSKRRAWESSTSKGKLGSESTPSWKTYCMESIQ
ncbi:uncharacterized protein LOC120353899 [Nilaparvata lugens]|uniref:uncharacterized protein LOC120353899 n=1 Tax=Nilaparvata lugens TaxID=108931 RepID=UPI00193D0DA7|nr:uncharacterized protein LOC120353899 [Nilaparvata lugens]